MPRARRCDLMAVVRTRPRIRPGRGGEAYATFIWKPSPADAMRQADPRIATRSERVIRQRGVGSVCEATALGGRRAGARLVVTRIVSADRYATARRLDLGG